MTTENEYVAPEETEQSEDYKFLESQIFGDQAEVVETAETEAKQDENEVIKKRGRKPGSKGAINKASLVLRIPAELEALYSSKEGRQLAAAVLELYSLPASQKRIAALIADGLSPQDCAKGALSEFAKVELETTIAELEEAEKDCDEQKTKAEESEEVANV